MMAISQVRFEELRNREGQSLRSGELDTLLFHYESHQKVLAYLDDVKVPHTVRYEPASTANRLAATFTYFRDIITILIP